MMLDKRFQKSVCLRHVPGCHENISGFVLFLLVDQAHDDYTVEIFHGDRITAIEHEKDRLAQSQRICVFFVEIGIVCKDIDSISAQAGRQKMCIRDSYNAMPKEGVEALVAFMKKFEEENA